MERNCETIVFLEYSFDLSNIKAVFVLNLMRDAPKHLSR